MSDIKATLRIDRELWAKIQAHARMWAQAEGFAPDGNTTRWVTKVLTAAVRAEEAP